MSFIGFFIGKLKRRSITIIQVDVLSENIIPYMSMFPYAFSILNERK